MDHTITVDDVAQEYRVIKDLGWNPHTKQYNKIVINKSKPETKLIVAKVRQGTWSLA